MINLGIFLDALSDASSPVSYVSRSYDTPRDLSDDEDSEGSVAVVGEVEYALDLHPSPPPSSVLNTPPMIDLTPSPSRTVDLTDSGSIVSEPIYVSSVGAEVTVSPESAMSSTQQDEMVELKLTVMQTKGSVVTTESTILCRMDICPECRCGCRAWILENE